MQPYKENTYFYDNQLKDYVIQFLSVFSGLKVKTGKTEAHPEGGFINVPVRYGSSDRVVAAIKAGNNNNTPIRLPAMAGTLMQLELAPEKYKGVGQQTRYSTMPRGGTTDDIRVVQMSVPIPYNAIFELSIMSSNLDNHWQLIEQILMLFNPTLQLQLSDDPHDWKKISMLELNSINFEENLPMGTDPRTLITSMTFVTTVYLSAPAQLKRNYIKAIKLRMDAIRSSENVLDVVGDVTRALPTYETLFDVDSMDLPPN